MTDLYVSLKEHFETRIAALEKATEVAARAMERRLDAMNEFREALKDQASRMMTRAEAEAALASIERDLRVLRAFQSTLEGKASQKAVNIALLVSAISILIALFSIAINVALALM